MPTTVHIPEHLLQRVDARARALGVSRNRLVVRALERELGTSHEWSPELVRLLSEPPSPGVVRAADEMETIIRKGRRGRKRPPEL